MAFFGGTFFVAGAFFGAASSGFLRQMTRIFPMDWTGSAPSLEQISPIHAVRASRSSVAAFTLMSSCALSARSISATTVAVSPLSPMMTTGERSWAFARNSLRRAVVMAGIGEL